MPWNGLLPPPQIRRAKTCRRHAFLLSTAIGAVAAGSALPWLATPAEAACVVTGSGAQAALQSGDSITCTGAGNTQIKTAPVVSGVTVNIGDGTATSVNDPTFASVVLEAASNSTVKVFGNATVTSANSDGIDVIGGGGNTITSGCRRHGWVDRASARRGLALANSSNDIIVIGGTVGNGVTGAISISIGAGSANNQANILSSGFVHAINVAAVDLSGAADGNVVSNAGTISSASGTAIIGSANQDTIINSGTIISGGVSTAVDLKGGNDVFELRAGSSITGWVLGGNGTDTLRLGGTANAAFNLSIFGAAGQFREFEALEKTGSSTWTMNGSTTEIATMNVLAGTVEVNGSMPNIATTVSGGILSGNGAIGKYDRAVRRHGLARESRYADEQRQRHVQRRFDLRDLRHRYRTIREDPRGQRNVERRHRRSQHDRRRL